MQLSKWVVCIKVTHLKLNPTFCVIWARINHFEARLMVLSQKNRLQSTQDGNLVEVFDEKKIKMATAMLENLDGFSLV